MNRSFQWRDIATTITQPDVIIPIPGCWYLLLEPRVADPNWNPEGKGARLRPSIKASLSGTEWSAEGQRIDLEG